jgi:hypothetical protein
VNRRWQLLAAVASLALALPVHAVRYIGITSFYSSDADDTEIAKLAVDLDLRHADREHYLGLSLESAGFTPAGGRRFEDERVYLRVAGGDAWKWSGRVGSDGHTVLGSAAIHNDAPNRQEYFIEREIIETPRGLQEQLYSTYVGGAFDLPFDERTTLTTVLGAQEFDGDNLRLHYRGNLIHSVLPAQGLSAQLRLRYFHDSDANELDYFAPGWYAQAIPTLQLRRHVGGWRYGLAAGYGRQRSAGTSWRPARLLEASISSPQDADWTLQAGFTYTNTPVNSGFTYDYQQFHLSLGRAF